MIGTKYTPELLAALAKTPRLAQLDVAVPPVGDDVIRRGRRAAGFRQGCGGSLIRVS